MTHHTLPKIAWVTGASSGIGKALVEKLVHKGWHVGVTARNEDALVEIQERFGDVIHIEAGDITNYNAMYEIVERLQALGSLELAILNAGLYEPVDGLNLDISTFDKTFDINLKGTTNCLIPAAQTMLAKDKGLISVVSSVTGYRGLPTSAAYGATKAALINLCECLKFDFDRTNVDIQVINPGFVDTPATQDNPFPMPFLVSAEQAAQNIIEGIESRAFEVTFPKRFTYMLKLLRLLPYKFYFYLVGKGTKWADKPRDEKL